MMMIVRSLGATTLVALMSAHRDAADQGCAADFDQEAVAAIETYLRCQTGESDAGSDRAIERRRSYN